MKSMANEKYNKSKVADFLNGDIDAIFEGIGKAKETKAKEIVDEQEKSRQEALNKMPKIFGGNSKSESNLFGDEDLDELEATVDAELELARRGIIKDEFSSDFGVENKPTAKTTDEPKKEEPVTPMARHRLNLRVREAIKEDEVAKEQEALGEIKDPDDSIEILSVRDTSCDSLYISVANDTDLGKSCFAVVGVAENGNAAMVSKFVDAVGQDSAKRLAPFVAANEAFNLVSTLGMKNVMIYADRQTSKVLRRNAVSMVDGYCEPCEKYIATAEALSKNVSINVSVDRVEDDYRLLADSAAKLLLMNGRKQ